MKDSWCTKIRAKSGVFVYGGAARNVRISNAGGMDEIIREVAEDAARMAISRAENLHSQQRHSRSNASSIHLQGERNQRAGAFSYRH